MVAVLWVASLAAGMTCLGAGILGLMTNPRSKAALLFLLAMCTAFVALTTGTIYELGEVANEDVAVAIGMTFVLSTLLAETFLWQLAIIFPVERRVSFRPVNDYGALILAGLAVAVVLGAFVGIETDMGETRISTYGLGLLVLHTSAMMIIAMIFIVSSRSVSNEAQRHSGAIYLAGLWVFAVSAAPYMIESAEGAAWMIGGTSVTALSLVVGVAVSGLIFSISIMRGQMVMMTPTTEVAASSTKASYDLLHRRIYLIEERKPELSFDIFVDILKGRCFDCENDDSFPCESIDCRQCMLPCPCRTCTKYSSRAQGLVVTRQYPNDVRAQLYIQTTPIVWLSTVPGKDHLDPAKLTLLTDMIEIFMEKSQNGVIIVDGVEYLMTSNDFSRLIKAVDRWSEAAMTNSTRLIITLDPRAFEKRELALLEKSKHVISA